MEVIWVDTLEIDNRIDAEYYRSEFVDAAHRLQAHVPATPLSELVSESNRIYIGIAGFKTVDAPASYTPYLRPVDITDEGFINYDGLPWCRREWLQEHAKKGCAKPNDVIVEVKGNTRKAAVVSDRIPPRCIVSGSSYRLRFRDGVDPHFAQAYFSCPSGQLLKRRLTSNTTINYIDPESFRGYKLPVPDFEIQLAIGSKLRKAERLRELASAIVRRVNEYFDSLIPQYNNHIRSSSWVHPSMMSDRMDPQPYRSNFVSLISSLKSIKSERLRSLAKTRGGCPVSSDDFSDIGVPLIRIRDIQSFGFAVPEVFVHAGFVSSRGGYAAGKGTIVVGMDGEFRTQFFLESELPALINQRVAIVEAKSMRPEYLCFFLSRPEGQLQLLREAVKTTVEHISLRDIDDVLVPRGSDDSEDAIADLIASAREQQYMSRALVESTRNDVENLLDGHCDTNRILQEGKAISAWLEANPLSDSTGNERK
jgi:type I restriction enzyme S subunit